MRCHWKSGGDSTTPSTAKFPTRITQKPSQQGWLKSGSPQRRPNPSFLSYCIFGRLAQCFTTCTAALSKTFQTHLLISNLQTKFSDPSCCPRFEFLKCFLVDPSFQTMHIETWFREPWPKHSGFCKGFHWKTNPILIIFTFWDRGHPT